MLILEEFCKTPLNGDALLDVSKFFFIVKKIALNYIHEQYINKSLYSSFLFITINIIVFVLIKWGNETTKETCKSSGNGIG